MPQDPLRPGAYEAQTHLSSPLDKVAKGKEIVITRRERPVARLLPIDSTKSQTDILAFHGRITFPKRETDRDLIQAAI